jgi:chemotaxis response regulator CheB
MPKRKQSAKEQKDKIQQKRSNASPEKRQRKPTGDADGKGAQPAGGSFPIVGVGASAGGLEAFTQFTFPPACHA